MSTSNSTRVRACLWDGGWFAVGPGYTTPRLHSHHAHQISIGLSGKPLGFRSSASEEWLRYPAAAIRADREHAFDGAGSIAVMLFIEPESYIGRWLERSMSGDISEIPMGQLGPLIADLEDTLNKPFRSEWTCDLVESVLKAVCSGPLPSQVRDTRIVEVLELLNRPGSSGIALEAAARAVHLSPSRFAHLFSEELGLPFRRYMLWRRLNRALLQIGAGHSFTAAAHREGFSDAAHLTRTFQQMFGLAPSQMVSPLVDFYPMPAPFSRSSAPGG